MAKQNITKIAGIDVSSKRISTTIVDEYQDKITKAVVELRFDVNDLLTIQKFQSVIIWEAFSGTVEQDSNRKFIGEISKIEKTAGKIKITCFDPLWKAIQTKVNQTFDVNIDSEAGEGSEIFKSLATLAGLTADSTSVQDTGTATTDIILDKFVCKKAEIYERMQALSDIYKYQFYHKPSVDKIFFEPWGFTVNSNVIQIGGSGNNVQGFPKWTEDATKIFNQVEIIGAFDEVQITEKFDGTGAQTDFILINEPEIVKIIVNGIEQVGGVVGSTATFDYSIDKSNKKIIFQSGSIPASGTNNIDVLYSYRAPRNVIRTNESSVATLGRIIENNFTFKDIQSVDDAERRGDKLLEIYSEEFVSTKVKMKPSIIDSFGIEAGQSIRVIDDRQGIDRLMVVKSMTTRFPENDVELNLGDKEVRIADIDFDNAKRLKRLEEEESKAQTFITASKDLKHTLQVSRRDLRVNEQDYTVGGGYSIWGLGTAAGYFNWGSGKWGTHDDAFDAEVEHTINQTNEIYNETFNDTDYKDSTSTTATWTTTGSATFTSGQLIQSSSIDLNNTTVVSATLTSTETNGSFDYEMSANNMPILQWKFNESGSPATFVDSVGNATGVPNATYTNFGAGKLNNAIELLSSDGGALPAKVTTTPLLNKIGGEISQYSICMWLKTSTTSGPTPRIIEKPGTPYPFVLRMNGQKPLLALWDGTNNPNKTASSDIVSGTWTHYCWVIDRIGKTINLYVNGVINGTAVTDTTVGSVSNTSNINFGNVSALNREFIGEIDDFRIYKTLLTQEDIDNIYNSGTGSENTKFWENVTSGVRHFFTNNGEDLRMRITENAASIGEISNVLINIGR